MYLCIEMIVNDWQSWPREVNFALVYWDDCLVNFVFVYWDDCLVNFVYLYWDDC